MSGDIHPPLAAALADEVAAAAYATADLGRALANDIDVLRRHMAVLQDVDRITQTLLAVADVLRPDRALGDRLDAILLEGLAGRLGRALGGPVQQARAGT